MTSIGETLRRERLQRNLDVRHIADQLKISSRFLEAIEEDRYDQLPGGVFAKSFVRQYALLMGLNADDLVARLQAILSPPVETPAEGEPKKPQIPQIRVENMDEWQSVGGSRSWSSSWVTAGALVVIAMIGCSLVYRWWWEKPAITTRAQEKTATRVDPVSTPTAPPPGIPAGPPQAQQPAVTPPAEALPQTAPGGTPLPATGTPAEAAQLAAPPAERPADNAAARPVRVTLVAKEAVWVRAQADGKVLFSGTINESQTRTFDADRVVEIRLGNAGGATLSLNGTPVAVEGFTDGTVGPKGQIRTIQLTPEGAHVVTAPKPEI
jgi:cytoskeleton protein RodZ